MRTIPGLLYYIAGLTLLIPSAAVGEWGWLLAVAGAISMVRMVDHEVTAALKEDE